MTFVFPTLGAQQVVLNLLKNLVEYHLLIFLNRYTLRSLVLMLTVENS